MVARGVCGQGMQNAAPKRFSEGSEVFARLHSGWEKAKILPLDNPGAAYKMEVISNDDMIYALADYEIFVREALPSAEEEQVMQGQIQQMQQQMQGGGGQGHGGPGGGPMGQYADVGPKRFQTAAGDTVYARLAAGWEEASVLENDDPATAYRIQVTSSGDIVYAPADADLYVRATRADKCSRRARNARTDWANEAANASNAADASTSGTTGGIAQVRKQ